MLVLLNSKYIETHYHFVYENKVNKTINFVKIKSVESIAYILTKP